MGVASVPPWLDDLRQRDAERLYTAAVDTMFLDSAQFSVDTIKAFHEFIQSAPRQQSSPSPQAKSASRSPQQTEIEAVEGGDSEERFHHALAAIRALRDTSSLERHDTTATDAPEASPVPDASLIAELAHEVQQWLSPSPARSRGVSVGDASVDAAGHTSSIAVQTDEPPHGGESNAFAEKTNEVKAATPEPPRVLPWRRIRTPAAPQSDVMAASPAVAGPDSRRSGHGTPKPLEAHPPPATSGEPPVQETFLQWDRKRSGDVLLTSDGTASRMDPAGDPKLYYCLGSLGVCRGEFAFEVMVEVASSVYTSANFFGVGVASKKYRGAAGPPCACYALRSDGAILSQSDSAVGVRFMETSLPHVCRVTVHVNLHDWEMSYYVDGRPQGVAFRFTPISDPEPLFPVVTFGRSGGSAVLVPPNARLPDAVSPPRIREQYR
jgi:hypothetical protein